MKILNKKELTCVAGGSNSFFNTFNSGIIDGIQTGPFGIVDGIIRAKKIINSSPAEENDNQPAEENDNQKGFCKIINSGRAGYATGEFIGGGINCTVMSTVIYAAYKLGKYIGKNSK